MDIIAQQFAASIYVENIYEGNLPQSNWDEIDSIPWQNWMQTWLQSLRSTNDLAQNCEIGLRISNDRQIQNLNCQYRSMDQPTDVLAFAAIEADISLPPDIAEPLYLGDIIISLDTALKQAQSQNHSLKTELAWLASHGLLHLLGWDHPDDSSLQKMLQQQSDLIQSLAIELS